MYGLSEIYSDKISKTNLVANPGCYPTSIILPLYPLLKEKLIDSNIIIADSKSGVSGQVGLIGMLIYFHSAMKILKHMV